MSAVATHVAVVRAALDTVAVAGAWSRHVFADAEAQADGTVAIVVRGDDRHKAGTDSNKGPAKRWNDDNGQPRPFTIATVSGPEAQAKADAICAGLIAFYGAEDKPLGERMAMLPDEAAPLALMLAASLQGGGRPHASSANHWRVGSIRDTKEAKRVEREKKDKAAAVATVVSAVKAGNTEIIASAISSDDDIAAMEALIARRKAELVAARSK